MYAIIKTGGKQYKVTNGDVIYIEKLDNMPEEQVSFDVLMYSADDAAVTVGAPYVEGIKATGKIIAHGRGQKIIVYKYKSKKGYARKKGHRQPFTKVEIVGIG